MFIQSLYRTRTLQGPARLFRGGKRAQAGLLLALAAGAAATATPAAAADYPDHAVQLVPRIYDALRQSPAQPASSDPFRELSEMIKAGQPA